MQKLNRLDFKRRQIRAYRRILDELTLTRLLLSELRADLKSTERTQDLTITRHPRSRFQVGAPGLEARQN
jgi:hypothetical protein